MLISSRLKRILQICLASDTNVSVDALASQLQISRRTVFRELQDAPMYLSTYELELHSKSKKGIVLVGSEDRKAQLKEDLSAHKVDYVNKEERRNLLIFEILREKDIQKLYYYANQFQVSESTISNDLDEIENWFAKYHLTIVRRPGFGIALEGKESDYRRALTQIITKSIQENEGYEKFNPQDALYLLEKVFLNEKDGIMKLLNQNILKRVLYVFDEYHHELSLDKYAQSSYIGLIIHLTIMIERTIQAESMEENTDVMTMMKQTQSYEQAKVMAHYLEKEFDIVIPVAEIAFIAMHIQGAKLNTMNGSGILSVVGDSQLQSMLSDMIAYFDAHLPYNLYLDDELFQGLLVHLKPALVRIQHHMHIYNPLLTQIKKDYMEVFAYTKQACQHALLIDDADIPEDEIGFLALHFGAAIERCHRKEEHMRPIQVGIVCSSGIGVSALLLARIRKIVDANVILKTYSVEEASREQGMCELFISTFQITTKQPNVLVNPLLDSDDMKKIKEHIAHLRKKVVVVNAIQEEALPYQNIVDDIFELLDQFHIVEMDANSTKDELLQQISHHFAQGCVAQKQIYEALLEREKVCSSIYPDFHFALFHATLSCIQKCAFALFRSKEKMVGELSELDYVIAMFLPIENSTLQKRMMSCINQSILEKQVFHETLKTKNQKAIVEMLEDIMKDFLFAIAKESRGK